MSNPPGHFRRDGPAADGDDDPDAYDDPAGYDEADPYA